MPANYALTAGLIGCSIFSDDVVVQFIRNQVQQPKSNTIVTFTKCQRPIMLNRTYKHLHPKQ